MNNLKNCNLKTALWLLFILTSFAANAQEGHRTFNFKQGEEYQSDILINSKAIVQRGKQTLNMNTVSTATKLFKVTLANAKGYTFNVKIKKMDNLIDAMGQRLHYNSEIKNDSTSTIIKALDFMLNKPIDVVVNKYGIIQSYTDYKAEMASDTLVAFAGLQPEAFEKGTLLSLVADITYNPGLKKGYTWTDSVEIDKQKLISKFWIEDINEKTSIVKFSSVITGKLLNSNSNGTYVIDNTTGLLLEKILYIISSGYQISAGGVVYAVSRSTSISQKTKQVK
ncbi:MAG: hypothetical protein V4541_05075 [Bacteroidota bacterium]